MDTPSTVASFLEKYDPEIASQMNSARKQLSALFPRGFELVYDNYNALVCGFGPTERASDTLVSVAAYPKWVTLFFLKGANLPDPGSVLQGSGSQVRSVRLAPISVLRSPPVQELLKRVIGHAQASLALAPPLTTVVKSVSARQRPRKPSASKRSKTVATRKGQRSGA